MPLKVLFKGWTQVPHSYAMVNCFQLINIAKYYKDQIDIYVQEMDYYQPHWNKAKKLVYNQRDNAILRGLKEYAGEPVDIVYSITYPYNITVSGTLPKVVFYTSEFSSLDRNYFVINGNGHVSERTIVDYVNTHKNLHFTSPSEWSARGMRLFGVPDARNRTITHGIDPDTFQMCNGQAIRDFYKIKQDDILLMNIGAMTRNKGIPILIEALNVLVNRLGKPQYKLLLKGTGDLYSTTGFLSVYIEEFIRTGAVKQSEMDTLLDNHIIFTDKTLSYEKINELYNAADIYVSPYLAEGFNLTTLESLCAGLPVIVPPTGSTKEYITAIKENGGERFIQHVNAELITITENGFCQNNILSHDLVQTIIAHTMTRTLRNELFPKMREYIVQNYSWKNVAGQLVEYFQKIANKM